MVHISATTPISIRRLTLPWLGSPWLAIGASLNAMPLLIGNALRMAYVDPYTSLRGQSEIVDDDLEGRDPNW